MRETVAAMQDAGIDNFTDIIPVVYYGTKKEAQAMKPALDQSIEKSFIMIRRHSMVFEQQERVKWVDDCYLIIGMCYFYEQDYSNARRTFQYILKTFEDDLLTKHSAQLWLAKTYIETAEYEKASVILDELKKAVANYEVKRIIRKQYPVVCADFYLSQKKYPESVKYLEEALSANKNDKTLKQRISFILGQIKVQDGKLNQAFDYFKKSSRGNDFYISFNSKIKMAQCHDIKDGGASITKTLTKMLKEDKNEEFRDQIYYALYEVAKRNGNINKEIEYLRLCVSTSVKNNYQKAIGAYTLAEIYYEEKDYIKSSPYYDTAVQFLPKEYADFVSIKERANVLGDLVSSLTVVQSEDSLQRIAKMPEAERNNFINKIISDLKEKERIAQELEMQRQRNYSSSLITQYENKQLEGRLGTGTTSWYFYNTQSVSAGVTDFKRRWGNRKLEDLWFLLDKQSFSWDELDEIQTDSTSLDTTQLVTDVMDVKYYTQYLPLTDEKMAASNSNIEQALYDAGFIAADRLKDYSLSNECFADMLKRFPKSKYALLSYYMQYMNCKELEDVACAAAAKSSIVSGFPESDYARLLQDPSYVITMRERMDAAKHLYNDVYLSYEDGLFDIVRLYSEEGLALNDKEYNPKFLYMSALADVAQNVDTEETAEKLRQITTQYADSDIAPVATELLAALLPEDAPVLDSATVAIMEKEKEKQAILEKEISQYKYKCNTQYFYVLVLDISKSNVKAIATRVSDYLIRYHKLDALTANRNMLNDTYEMVTVSSFSDCNTAMDFYENALENNYIYSGLAPDAYYHFVISQENYPAFYKSKNIEAYLYFFDSKIVGPTQKN